ncbi:MAG: 7,8-didemethyl-8-hydroxy-5-deazariboflavin synthase subunit CofG [Chloroflexi bacterium]|nr:MAG: 7,8-didemethyl-8-hydroxy-5-deazariboflavin synthase subunit CofG [Chloroflexota bacterium]RUA32861.1 MAG: 7,8-didemethyl-8-hydroxy-5-deazariboflavin synthase subunit CofG [Chloroflexota bacterium]
MPSLFLLSLPPTLLPAQSRRSRIVRYSCSPTEYPKASRSFRGWNDGVHLTVSVPSGEATQVSPPLEEVISKAKAGYPLSDSDALSFLAAGQDATQEICAAAADMRDQAKGNTVTFSPKVFIPLTHMCRDFCGYCTFRKDPQQAGKDLYMTPEQVLDVANAGAALGCTEALFTLGERPEQRYPEAKEWLEHRGFKTTLEYLTYVCELVLQETDMLPHANPGTMARREIEALKPFNPSMGLMLESTSKALYAKGGPHEFAPSKRPRVRLRTLELAGQLRVPFTTGILIGIGESRWDRIESLLAIAGLHAKYGHVQEVIIQNFRAKPDTAMGNAPDAETDEFLWTVAVARLILGTDANLQVPPNLSAKDYQIYLGAGINDWGGVSPLTPDFVNPEAPWPALTDLKKKTEAAGFKLRPRLPVYPEYFLNTNRFLLDALSQKVSAMADAEGYVQGGMERYDG